MAIELLVIEQKQPGLLEAINANGLFTFLLVNRIHTHTQMNSVTNVKLRPMY